jgi:Protein of unknown function (DUF4235)
MADKKVDFNTRVFNALTTMAASFVARKVVTFAWTKATGKEPPTNPEDPGVALTEALSWSVLTGVTVATMRILAVRAVSRKILSSADREPANAADG